MTALCLLNENNSLLSFSLQEYDVLPREQWCKLEAEQSSGPTLRAGESHWPVAVTLELGTYMVDMMVKNLKMYSNILSPSSEKKLIPILYHMYTFRSLRQVQWSLTGISKKPAHLVAIVLKW